MKRFFNMAYRSLRRIRYSKLKAVVFDVDEVLRDSIPHTWEALCATMRDFGIERTPTLVEFYAYYTEPWHEYYSNYGVKASNESVFICYMRHWDKVRHLPRFFQEVRQVVLALKALGLELAIVTMNSEDSIRGLLKEERLEEYFSIIEGGAERKSMALKQVCERLSIQPRESVYIGDLQSDMFFANEAGLLSIARHPPAVKLPEDACIKKCEVDERVTHLSEIIHFARRRI